MDAKQLLRRVFIAALVPLALFVSLLSWALASPIGASPDDDYHMASIWCAGGTDDLCEAGDESGEMRVPAFLLEASQCYQFEPNASASCPETPSNILVSSSRGNFDGGYPPVFYATMSLFSGSNLTASVIVMRAANAFLFVGVATLVFFLLPRSRRGPLVWGGLISIVPLGMFLIPSVNPSSWAIISAMTLWISLVAYFKAKERWRTVTFGVIAFFMALIGAGARGDAAIYSGMAAVLALVLAFEKSRRFLLMAILPIALGLMSVGFFLNTGQSEIVNPEVFNEDTSNTLWLIKENAFHLPSLWAGALGGWGLGWIDTDMPGAVWVTAIAAYAAVSFCGLRVLDRRKGIAVALMALALILIPMYILVHDRVVVGYYVQPRYIYPLMIMFAGVVLFRLKRPDLHLSRVQMIVVTTMLALANSIALHVNLRRYITGVDVPGFNLDIRPEWWWDLPITPMTLWAVGSIAFAAALAGVVVFAAAKHQGPVMEGDSLGQVR